MCKGSYPDEDNDSSSSDRTGGAQIQDFWNNLFQLMISLTITRRIKILTIKLRYVKIKTCLNLTPIMK